MLEQVAKDFLTGIDSSIWQEAGEQIAQEPEMEGHLEPVSRCNFDEIEGTHLKQYLQEPEALAA